MNVLFFLTLFYLLLLPAMSNKIMKKRKFVMITNRQQNIQPSDINIRHHNTNTIQNAQVNKTLIAIIRKQQMEANCNRMGYKKSSIGENNDTTRWLYNLSEPRTGCPTVINRKYKFLFYVLCYNDRTCYKAYHIYGCFAW